MLLAVALSRCDACDGWPVVSAISALTASDTGIIIAGTLLLFPTAGVLYGVMKMYFAAREWAERRLDAAFRRGYEQAKLDLATQTSSVPVSPSAAAGARVRIGEAVGRFDVNEKGEVTLTFKPEDIAFLFGQPDEQA